MRVLHCGLDYDGRGIAISLEEHNEAEVPPYVILSHRWGPLGDEVTFNDLVNGTAQSKAGFEKLEGCCRQALNDGFSHVWIDTCCIDKSSSAELSEAINSMYRYYSNASFCYAYLQDVAMTGEFSSGLPTTDRTPQNDSLWLYDYGQTDSVECRYPSTFTKSEWFKRGWTLQELLAPENVIFFSQDWTAFGSKNSLAKVLHTITGIEPGFLSNPSWVRHVNVATRMSWAAARSTTRIEDRAYSLMGIFGINMPILYGEGANAFRRLQLEIIKSSNDHSIFTWDVPQHLRYCDMFAESVDQFSNGSNIDSSYEGSAEKGFPGGFNYFEPTNQGLHIWLPVQAGWSIVVDGRSYPVLRARLNCSHAERGTRRISSLFTDAPGSPFYIYLYQIPEHIGTCMRVNPAGLGLRNGLVFNGAPGESEVITIKELFIRKSWPWGASISLHSALSSHEHLRAGDPRKLSIEIDCRQFQSLTILDSRPKHTVSSREGDLLTLSPPGRHSVLAICCQNRENGEAFIIQFFRSIHIEFRVNVLEGLDYELKLRRPGPTAVPYHYRPPIDWIEKWLPKTGKMMVLFLRQVRLPEKVVIRMRIYLRDRPPRPPIKTAESLQSDPRMTSIDGTDMDASHLAFACAHQTETPAALEGH